MSARKSNDESTVPASASYGRFFAWDLGGIVSIAALGANVMIISRQSDDYIHQNCGDYLPYISTNVHRPFFLCWLMEGVQNLYIIYPPVSCSNGSGAITSCVQLGGNITATPIKGNRP